MAGPVRLLASLALLACGGRRSTPSPAPSASAAAAPLPSPPASAAASAPAAGAPRLAPTSMTSRRLAVGERASLASVTLVQTEPDHGALLLNESTGDFLVVTVTGEGERLQARAPGLEATLQMPAGQSAARGLNQLPGSIRVGPAAAASSGPEPAASAGAAASAAPLAPVASGAPGSGPPSAPLWVAPGRPGAARRSPDSYRIVSPDVALTDVESLEGDPLYLRGAARAGRSVHLWHHAGRWLIGVPDPAPRPTLVGGQPLRPERVEPGRELGCLAHGLAPTIEGPMAEVMAATWRGWVRERCASGGPGAIVEVSYRLIALAGVNLPDLDGVTSPGRAPGSTTIVPMNLRARVTTEDRSGLVEEAFVIDAATGSLPRLDALLAPDGRARIEREALEPWTVWEAGWLRAHPRARAEAMSGATLAVGPTSIDLVLPMLPYGVLMPTRRVPIGPRSTLAPAFVSTPAARRLTAAVNVDY